MKKDIKLNIEYYLTYLSLFIMVNWYELYNFSNNWVMDNLPPIDDIDYYNFKEEPFDTSFYTDYDNNDWEHFIPYNQDNEYYYEDDRGGYNDSSSDSEEDFEYYDY
ncbi:MAG: hypothetical protein HOJ35_02255 [Bdellovibrionales bacterium]|nr:hypothetical protein [Bdellovibrionales bacterium]